MWKWYMGKIQHQYLHCFMYPGCFWWTNTDIKLSLFSRKLLELIGEISWFICEYHYDSKL